MKLKLFALLAALLPIAAFAEDKLDSGDTAWMMMSTALVLLMTPAGLALFYAGMSRSKNALNTYAMVMGAFVLAFVVWIVAGYSLAFGTSEAAGIQKFIGGFGNIFLDGVKWNDLSGTYPTFVFIAFQGTFAAITVAIASGSVIGRMKFSTWMVIVALWGLVVYAPITHMVWGGEGALLFDAGALDFAGGTVVHMNGGLAGLVLAILVGKRTGYNKMAMKPFSIIFTAAGAALLWFGWYGFNAGSAFGANAIAGVALLTTTIATAAAGLTWLIIEWIVYKKPTLLGIASGIVAGLVAITPAAGFVSIGGALFIGAVGSAVGLAAAPPQAARVITITQLDDEGSTGGNHDASVSVTIAATTTVVAVDDDPTISIDDDTVSVAEDNNFVFNLEGVSNSLVTVHLGTKCGLQFAQTGSVF